MSDSELDEVQLDSDHEATGSSSTPELHDVDWDEVNRMFTYSDHLSQSPQIRAVIENDLPRLKLLLGSGKCVNVNDNSGNTPLHVSICGRRQRIFDYLLSFKNTRIDATNFEGVSPLFLALEQSEDNYALELLKKGADVNITRNSGDTPLHYAVNKNVEIAHQIVQKGAPIDARNNMGETPLFTACENNQTDCIHMLLYYGADPTVSNEKEISLFATSVTKCSFEIQEILFNYTFGTGQYVVHLENFVLIMASQSPIFYEIMKKQIFVCYNEEDFGSLLDNLPYIKMDMFRLFIQKNRSLCEDFFRTYNPIKLYACRYFSGKNVFMDFVELFCVLDEVEFMDEVVNQFKSNLCLSSRSLVDPNLSEDSLTKLLFCLLSHGVVLTSTDVDLVFTHYKYGNLFKLLLHQEIIKKKFIKTDFIHGLLLPKMIYEPQLILNLYFWTGRTDSRVSQSKELRKFFFINPGTAQRTSHGRQSFYRVPLLIEFAREASKQYLIHKYNIKNNVQFYTMLKWLPICQTLKEIISYERPIYT